MPSPSVFVPVLCGKSRPDEQSSGNDRERCKVGAEASKRRGSPLPPKASSFPQISAARVLEPSARVRLVTQDATWDSRAAAELLRKMRVTEKVCPMQDGFLENLFSLSAVIL